MCERVHARRKCLHYQEQCEHKLSVSTITFWHERFLQDERLSQDDLGKASRSVDTMIPDAAVLPGLPSFAPSQPALQPTSEAQRWR